jgi:tetratricopeptide (TPR) repeat protein
MKRRKSRLLISIFLVGLIVKSIVLTAAAAERCDPWLGKVVSVQGKVEAQLAGETTWIPVRLNDTFCTGDMIRVQERSRVAVVLPNEAILRLDQKTTITFNGIEKEKTSLIDMLRGVIHFFSRTPRCLRVATPFVNGTVEGTEFLARVDLDQAFLSIFEGRVLAENEVGSLLLASGDSATVRKGEAPRPVVVVRPRDAVRWALYYPPVADYRPADFEGGTGTDWRVMVRRSINAYWEGDLIRAFAELERAPEDIRDPRFFTYRAGLLLTVGRVDEAEADVDRSLALDPSNANAFALKAIIAMVQNRKDQSLELAKKAVGLDPKSSVARVALSYSQQAYFDLEGALKSLEEAVNLDPGNALAFARLSELWLSQGYLDKALEVAQKAVALNPNLERTQTILGFAYLTQIKTKDSKNAFEKAIQLDQAAPLPRLGLGLAKIRDGDLKEGREEIEIAAALDPNNALIRSYLGKAYFEEKRTTLDGEQYKIAKDLDPLDPTPWFYDAIRKQTVNRPVEALHDLQKAIELNDNRAVYRSKLQLDSDLAARSASVARIYNDLGFQQLALVEGWKSVNTDPSNFSAHRFLADTYAVLPRHEIARVSELLQSQLLQPINITPIQPRLPESNLFLTSAQGAADLSFREFNPLFNRDRVALQTTGLGGENTTWAGEGIASLIYKKVSGSAGYAHFETDGFRINNDQDDDIANVFGQLQLTHKTSIQAEYRYRETENGDLLLRFDPNNFFPNRREKLTTDSIRFGFHHIFCPGFHLIGNFIQSNSDIAFDDTIELSFLTELFPGFFVPATTETIVDVKTDNETYGGELQYQFRSEYIDLVGGAGYFETDSRITKASDVTLSLGPPINSTTRVPTPLEVSDSDVKHPNLYLYSYIKPLKNLTFTVGASGNFFDGGVSEVEDKDQFNPKFGFIWSPVPNTTLRGAIFRTLTRTLVGAQTIEPTQVAGFNQFFFENRSTDVWRYGGAIDQKFSERIYGGVEFSERVLEVPAPVGGVTFPNQRVDWKEYFGRAYFLWTPYNWLGLSAEYLYEKFDYAVESNPGAEEVKTHSFPIGINFFHPSGFGFSLKATYYDQEGVFQRVDTSQFFPGKDDFWVVDGAINYRLPKRYGFITVGAKNLFDKEFNYYETDPNNPRIQPGRYFFLRATFSIP